MSGEVTDLDPPHLLAWTFNGELYRFELSADPIGCLLVFTHVFDDRSLSAQTATGWAAYLSRLEPHLAGEFRPRRTRTRDGLTPTSATPNASTSTLGPGRRFAAQFTSPE